MHEECNSLLDEAAQEAIRIGVRWAEETDCPKTSREVGKSIAEAIRQLKINKTNMGFEDAWGHLKRGGGIFRTGWKGRPKFIRLVTSSNPKILSYPALMYEDGTISPWTPTRCDLLENDWVVIP